MKWKLQVIKLLKVQMIKIKILIYIMKMINNFHRQNNKINKNINIIKHHIKVIESLEKMLLFLIYKKQTKKILIMMT